jgi:dTMP kinase
MKKNLFIVFEGIDGSGKDTQMHKLSKKIRDDSRYPFGSKYDNVWITREPTKITPSGMKVSKIIKGEDFDNDEVKKLFITDRIEHSKIISEFLIYSHVLCSRYDLSTYSYQMEDNEDFYKIYEMNKYSQEGSLIPDLTIVFDVEPEIALMRLEKRNTNIEVFEKLEILKKVRKNMFFSIDSLRKRDGRNIIVIDANCAQEEIFNTMIHEIADAFKD